MCIVSSHYICSNIVIQRYVSNTDMKYSLCYNGRYIKCTEPYANGGERANYASEVRFSNFAELTKWRLSIIKPQKITDASLGYIFSPLYYYEAGKDVFQT